MPNATLESEELQAIEAENNTILSDTTLNDTAEANVTTEHTTFDDDRTDYKQWQNFTQGNQSLAVAA